MRKGTDQCNINVSISTKLSSSSSSRENRIAAPVNMTLSNMIPALNSPSSLSDNIFRIETQTYSSSPGVMTEENSEYKLRGRCVCMCIFHQGSNSFFMNTILVHHPKHATVVTSLTGQTD